MTQGVNRRWRLETRPTGLVDESHFRWAEEEIPKLTEDGQILVRNLYLSMDPAQRGWMARDTYMPAVPLGDVMRAFAVGRVEDSRHPDYARGDLVQGLFGWQDYAPITVKDTDTLTKVPPGVPILLSMSALGITGLTAYFGLLEIGRPVAGETVVVSGAAGATGSVAGQIAKIKGCRAIGIAGGADKCAWLTKEAGFDAAIDYKSENVQARLKELCPKGINVYFDNVGGEILDAALARLAHGGRVVICGAISTYSSSEPPTGPKNYMSLLLKRARMEGFVVTDYGARFPEAVKELGGWVKSGKLKDQVDVQEGLENAPKTLRRVFEGKNQGKQLLKIADP